MYFDTLVHLRIVGMFSMICYLNISADIGNTIFSPALMQYELLR
jgi:hypothetical protein